MVAMHVGRAIVDALPTSDRHWRCSGVAYSTADEFDGGASIPLDRDSGDCASIPLERLWIHPT